MKSSTPPKVRLVRCPRCKEVLPEPTDVPFYRCGGCGTTLQAKHYKKANERRETVSEGSGSVQNTEVKQCARGGEASSSSEHISSARCSLNQNDGINESCAQSGYLENLGVLNSSREASSSNQPNQPPPSSSAQHFPEIDEERDQSLEVKRTLREDSSLNEPNSPSHQIRSNLSRQTGKVEGDHRSVKQHEESKASSSNDPIEQPAQLAQEDEEVRQDEIVVQAQLEAADSSSEAASSKATTTRTEKKALSVGQADELNQNVSTNCRLEQPEVASFPVEVLLSNERNLHQINNSSRVAVEEDKVEGSSTKVKEEQVGVSRFGNGPSLSNEPTVDGKELCSQFGSPNEEMVTMDQNFAANPREGQPGLKSFDSSSWFLAANQEGEGDNVVENCSMEQVGAIYSNSVISSKESMLLRNIELLQLSENEEMDEGKVQNKLGELKEDQFVDNLPCEIVPPAGVNSLKTEESARVAPDARKASDLNLSSQVLAAPYEYGNCESLQAVEADPPLDGNNRVPGSPILETVKEAEIVNLADRSQKIVETNPREKVLQKTASDGFESAVSSKVTETTEVVDAHLEVGTSHRDLPKSPTRNSFAYDGSVSSYDGNDDQVAEQIPCETIRQTSKAENPVAEDKRQFSGRSTTYSGSAFQHQTDYTEAVSAGENHSSAEQRAPIMLREVKRSEALRHGSSRRNRMRPRTGEFPSRVPLYRISPEMIYESSSHHLHDEFFDHLIHRPPYRYRDNIEPRITRRHLHDSDVDGRMFAEAVWMGEELHMHPYHETSGEIYPYTRHQMYHRGGRQAEYQPLVHGMARIPYSGETVRSVHRVHDSYSHLHPRDMRWSSQLPPPGVYYNRGRYSSRETYDSYTASPQVFTDSEYYAWSHDTISEDQRMSKSRLRRNSQPVQHFRPIGGAAPFITCYQCSELLQLPSDFLLFKGIRIHRVKCSACSSILKFALEKGCHLVPYASKPIAPLNESAEKGDFDRSLKSASTSQANHDYEALHRRSVSASVYAGNSQDRNAEKGSLHRSSEALERRKGKVEGMHAQDKGKSIMVEMHNNTAGTSPNIPRHPKVTWELPNRSSSPLHRLMGYASPSAVLFGDGSGDSDTQE